VRAAPTSGRSSPSGPASRIASELSDLRPVRLIDDSPERDVQSRLSGAASRFPRGSATVVTAAAALAVLDRLGVTAPGVSFIDRVLNTPWVVFFARGLVVMLIALAYAVILWVLFSVGSHVKNKRWIRKIAGFEPQALHRSASEIEEGYAELRVVLDASRERNAELTTALSFTTDLARRQGRRIDELEQMLKAAGGGQLFP
jgi:hypothetical protein